MEFGHGVCCGEVGIIVYPFEVPVPLLLLYLELFDGGTRSVGGVLLAEGESGRGGDGTLTGTYVTITASESIGPLRYVVLYNDSAARAISWRVEVNRLSTSVTRT